MFKKILSIILCTLLCGAQFTFANAENNISVYIDGTKIEFDVNPILVDGRTLVPMRAIFEAMGADVLWDNNTSTVTATKSDTIINLSIGSNVVFKNGTPIAIDVPAQLVNGRTLVPVRAVSESFDCNVDWIGETNTVVIASNYSTTGNTNGNLANLGLFAYSDGWVYYYKNHGLYKTKSDGTSVTLLSNESCRSINVVGDWVYYVSGQKVVKIKKDGTARTVLSWIDTAQDCMVISNNIMYYLDTWGNLFSVNLDGTNAMRIGDFTSLFFQVEGDWIYYNPEISPSGLTTGNICRIKIDGTQQSKIVDCSAYDFNVVDGWIYYRNVEYQNSGVFKARTDGSGNQLIIKANNITDINVFENNLYYFSYYDLYTNPVQGELRRTDLDGKNDSLIKKCEQGIPHSIGTFENMIGYSDFDGTVFDIISLNAVANNVAGSNFGTLYNVLGNRAYEGELKNGQPHGIGTAFFEDGYTISYHGEFKNGEPCGKGIMYYEDGEKYIEGDIPSGTGKFYSETTGELFYEGEYVDLLLNGIGTMYFDDGSYYIGEFKNNLLHGKGTLYSKDGIAIANKVFENNELISYIDLGYNAEYDELMEWANEEYDKIYAEAEKVYKRAYQEAYDYYYYLLCGHITASGSDTFAAANAQRQIKAILPQVEDAATKEAELAEKEYLAETLEKFAAFLESEVEALNDKYNIK